MQIILFEFRELTWLENYVSYGQEPEISKYMISLEKILSLPHLLVGVFWHSLEI